ncbi:MAG: hypothetical protein PHX30_03265 [Candidatus Pacebacteria bacterium]|nr:hypothetical protein [Candidatus Paceibacterota bacterium]
MINWINFLHIYQPPEQEEEVFHQVARESYFEIAKFFDLYDGLKLTMNLSGSLLEQLVVYHYDGLLEDFSRAFSNGEIELVGSAMYHPILPLLPEEEIERQILLDEKIKKEIFGGEYKRCGFYLPEMAYSRRVAEVLEKMGFEWIILDEISYCGKLNSFDKEKIFKVKDLNMKVVFRDRQVSDYFVPEKINEISDEATRGGMNIITATDGELYGHHHHDFYSKTKEAFTDGNIRSLRISEFIEEFGKGDLQEIDPVASNWESTEDDLAKNIPFSYWDFPGNSIQGDLWGFANFAIGEISKNKEDKNYKVSRNFLDQGLSSCHFWAASGKKSAIWKDTIWNPDSIERGNMFLIKAMRSLSTLETSRRMEAEKRFLEIAKNIWDSHWNKFYRS